MGAFIIYLRVRPHLIGRGHMRGNCVTFFDLRQYGLHFSAYFLSSMKRTCKYRFYPTPGQVELLAQTFGCVRFVYNSILRWRTDACYKRQEKIGYTQASARLTALKKEPEFAWLNDVSSVPLQQALRHQQAATFTDVTFKYRDGKCCTWQRAKRL